MTVRKIEARSKRKTAPALKIRSFEMKICNQSYQSESNRAQTAYRKRNIEEARRVRPYDARDMPLAGEMKRKTAQLAKGDGASTERRYGR